MLRRSKALIVAVVAAAGVATAVPATAADAGVAVGPCRGDMGLAWEEWHQTIFVTGVYAPARAINVQLTCGVVRYGETVGRVGEDVFGPVAVVHGSVRTLAGPVSFCHEAVVTYVDRIDYLDTCP